MNALEDSIGNAVSGGHFTPDSTATAVAFHVMGSLLPDESATDSATGASRPTGGLDSDGLSFLRGPF